MRSKIHKAVIYAISLLFVIIFWVCIRQQLDSSSSQSGGKYDVRMSTTGVITMLGNEVKIRIDDNAGRLPGEEVQIEFSKVITNPKTIIKGKRQILMRSDTKSLQPFASWSNSL